MLADTHIHTWNFSRAAYSWLDGNTTLLNRTYLIEEIETERIASGIQKGILVQAANSSEDTEWMLDVARQTGWIAGVVGWLPLTDPEATGRLLQEVYSREPLFKGVRHLVHDEADPRWLLQPAVLESLQLLAERDIPYDIVGVLPEHIETALQVAEKVPGLRMVFDHLNQPPISGGERFGRWGMLLKEAAALPCFYAKISGLGTTSQQGNNWSGETIRPYVEFALEHFGTGRCFCGGDWPVSLLAGSYSYSWTQYKELLSTLLTEPERGLVFYQNAADFYTF